MNTAAKIKLGILGLAALAFTACGNSSALTDSGPAAGDPTPVTHIAYRDLACRMAVSPEGVYEVAWLRPGACNLLYLDAASQKEIFLCASPSCSHNTEVCSSYLEVGESGSSYNIFYCNDHLYALRNMGGTEFPYLMELAPDGTQRRTVMTLNSGEMFTGTVLGYGNSILCEISVLGDDTVSRPQLEKIDLETGSREVLFQYPGEKGSSLSLLGAAGTSLYYLATDKAEYQYYAVDLSQGITAFDTWQDHPVGPGFDGITRNCSVQGDYFCTLDTATNTLAYENLVTGVKSEFAVPELNPGDTLYGYANLYDDRFAVILYNEEEGSRYVLLDPETNQPTGVEYATSKNNGIDIVGQYQDWLICNLRTAEMDLLDQDQAGLSGEIAYHEVYTMVKKADFWNGTLGGEIPFPEL